MFFIMAALCLSLGLMEGIAWTLETFISGRDQLYPLPLPEAMQPEKVNRLTALKHELSLGIPMVEDPERGWAFPPNTGTWPGGGGNYARINSLGMRGPEVGPRKRGEARILTLGDSSIYGDWVSLQDVFSNVAARILSRRWKRSVISVIGAVPGYDSRQSLLTLRKHGKTVNPTHVVIGNIWSDLHMAAESLPLLARHDSLSSSLQRLACYRMLGRIIRPHLRPHVVGWITRMEDIGASPDGADSRVSLRVYYRNLQLIVYWFSGNMTRS